jgi:hypothetical protein
MAIHTRITPDEAADRLAIRELFDAYAHCADRRDAEGQKALFTADTRFAVYMSGDGSEPTYVLEGREALTPVFADLNRYETTTHFNGQSRRQSQDHGRLAALPRCVRQDRRQVVLRRAQAHSRLE